LYPNARVLRLWVLGFIYDAVFAAVEGIVHYQRSQQPAGTQLRFPSVLPGNALASTLAVQNVTVVGATGNVGFEAGVVYLSHTLCPTPLSPPPPSLLVFPLHDRLLRIDAALARAGIGGIPDYGWGDRVQGVRYKVVNYQTNGNCEGQVMQRVGTWTNHDMFVPCAQDPVYLADPVLYGGCTDIDWFTADNLPTPDQPAPVVYLLPAGLRSFFTFMTVMVWLAMIATTVLLAVFRKSRIIHVSQTPILALILAGCFYGAIRVSLITADVPTPQLCTGVYPVPLPACLETVQRNSRRAGRPPKMSVRDASPFASACTCTCTCTARYWMGHLAFTVVPAFLAKTLRVKLVVSASSSKKVNA